MIATQIDTTALVLSAACIIQCADARHWKTRGRIRDVGETGDCLSLVAYAVHVGVCLLVPAARWMVLIALSGLGTQGDDGDHSPR